MQTKLPIDELTLEQITKKEELENNYYTWIQSHFSKQEQLFIDELLDCIEEETFFGLAEQWASSTFKNKLHY